MFERFTTLGRLKQQSGEWLFCVILRTPVRGGIWSNSSASTAMVEEEI